MDRKTKKMVACENKLAELSASIGEAVRAFDQLTNFEPKSNQAKEVKAEEVRTLQARLAQLRSEVDDQNRDHELATIEMLAGKDILFADPTPTEELRDAS